jgi:hypothetical protein
MKLGALIFHSECRLRVTSTRPDRRTGITAEGARADHAEQPRRTATVRHETAACLIALRRESRTCRLVRNPL